MKFGKYHVLLDFSDTSLKDTVLDCLLGMPFLSNVCVLEASPRMDAIFPRMPRDLVIFEDCGSGLAGMEKYCLRHMEVSPNAIFISISGADTSASSLPLICMSRTLLMSQFSNLIGFCYLTAVIRRSVGAVKNGMDGRS